MRILLICNSSWGLANFRTGLIAHLIASSHEVIAAAPRDDFSHKITATGARFEHIDIDPKGANPLKELASIITIFRLIKRCQADLVISYTIKPVIYGAITASWLGTRAISVVTGLGTAHIKESLLTRIVEFLYRLSQRSADILFFLNKEDYRLFHERQLAPTKRMRLLPGEGVDLEFFSPLAPQRQNGADFEFLVSARLLWDKGIGEYINASKIVKRYYPDTRFSLIGFLDAGNRTAIPKSHLDSWINSGAVHYYGAVADVRPFLATADCVVLPSYREGLPRSLLEAAAMARPIIATNVVGCRDIVDDQKTGFLCNVADAQDLAEKMLEMRSLSEEKRALMGELGRLKVEKLYGESKVFNEYDRAIEHIKNDHQKQ